MKSANEDYPQDTWRFQPRPISRREMVTVQPLDVAPFERQPQIVLDLVPFAILHPESARTLS